ncbi:MAG: NYN domain-containing protein [Bacilli bacterium]|nr:NYN domain-containing protein [Bacilli bacterium]
MEDKKIALLIDVENVAHTSIKFIIDDLSQRGTICIKRVYCVTGKLSEEGVKNAIKDNNLEIRTQYNVVSGKSASDFNLVIDAMEMLYTKSIDCFAIVSSDSDFNILVNKIKSENKIVIGYGEKKTNPQFRSNYNEFIFVENLLPNTTANKQELIKESKVISFDKLEKEICSMISQTDNDTMLVSQISEKISAKYPDFDSRTYGYKKFSEFIKSMESISILKAKDGHTFMAKLNFNEKTGNEKNESNEKVIRKLIIKVLEKNDGKANLAQINNLVKKEDPSFSLKKYGVSRFKQIIDKYNWSEIKYDNNKKPNYILLIKKM